jgi:hypothetical protein
VSSAAIRRCFFVWPFFNHYTKTKEGRPLLALPSPEMKIVVADRLSTMNFYGA